MLKLNRYLDPIRGKIDIAYNLQFPRQKEIRQSLLSEFVRPVQSERTLTSAGVLSRLLLVKKSQESSHWSAVFTSASVSLVAYYTGYSHRATGIKGLTSSFYR